MRKTAVVAVLMAACASSGNPGTYEAVLPAASGGGERHIRVVLHPDGFAAVFERAGDQLIAREWEHSLWGEKGPGMLYRVR